MNDQEAIKQLAANVDAAFNAGDSTTMASYWVDDGLNVNPFGDAFRGRTAIASDLHESLTGFMKGSRHELAVTDVYRLNDDIAVADGVATITGVAGPDGHDFPPLTSNFTLICSKTTEGDWQVEQLRAYQFTPKPR